MSIDEWAINLAFDTALRGKCPRRQTGAVALDRYDRLMGVGYNGQPRGFHRHPEFRHCNVSPCPGVTEPAGSTDLCEAVHCEVNLILNVRGDSFDITKVYITDSPCHDCALMLCNLPNLECVMYGRVYADTRGIEILRRSRITTRCIGNLVHPQHKLGRKN